jgi:Uma2 family endonuclease
MEALFTRREYDRLPEGFPAQLVEGRLVKEPSPTYGHQRAASRLYALLVARFGPDRVLHAPADVVLDDHNVYQPDLVVLDRVPPLHRSDVGIPRVAVEILSPATQRRDRRVKTPRLLAAGVHEVWLVDPEAGTIEVHGPTGVVRVLGAEPVVSRALPDLVLTPDDLFAERP